jgi:hypothetical protein
MKPETKVRSENLAFIGSLCHGNAELVAVISGSIEAYGELIPHLWMHELTQLISKRQLSDETASMVIDRFEEELQATTSAIVGMITASFIENLPPPAEGGKLFLKGRRQLEQFYDNIFGT